MPATVLAGSVWCQYRREAVWDGDRVSGAYLLDWAQRMRYHPPRHGHNSNQREDEL